MRHEKRTDKLSVRQQSIYCVKKARNALSRTHCLYMYVYTVYIGLKVFRIIPEFRILRLTFYRKTASKCWIQQIVIGSIKTIRGQKFHSSARIDMWILGRTGDSSQSACPTGRVLKSASETSIFWMAGSVFIEPNTFSIPKVETGCCDCKWRIKLCSIMGGSVVDCIEVNIYFFGAHFHQWNRFV